MISGFNLGVGVMCFIVGYYVLPKVEGKYTWLFGMLGILMLLFGVANFGVAFG